MYKHYLYMDFCDYTNINNFVNIPLLDIGRNNVAIHFHFRSAIHVLSNILNNFKKCCGFFYNVDFEGGNLSMLTFLRNAKLYLKKTMPF